jgi:hypothetical protein
MTSTVVLKITVNLQLLVCKKTTATVVLTQSTSIIATAKVNFTCSGNQIVSFAALNSGKYTVTVNLQGQPSLSKTIVLPPNASISFTFK